jgi:hypothetical protein
MDQLRTPNSVMGVEPDTIYQSSIQEIDRSSRLYVFSDGVYDIKKVDGSIWGFKKFFEFSIQSFSFDQPNLDCLLGYVQDLTLKKEFEDDFTILVTFLFTRKKSNNLVKNTLERSNLSGSSTRGGGFRSKLRPAAPSTQNLQHPL